MRLLVHHLGSQHTTAHENTLDGPEKPSQSHDIANCEPAIFKRRLPGINFRHDFAKEEEDKSEDDGDAQELQPNSIAEVNNIGKYIVA